MTTQELQLGVLYKIISDFPKIGKTRLQKMSYLLQEAMGLPTRYQFRMHHYGPYADSIETNVSRLGLTGYVGIALSPTGYGFEISTIDQPAVEWGQLIETHRSILQNLEDRVRQLSTSELELWATIHFVQQLLKEAAPEEVISSVKALKPRFEESYVSRAWENLEQWVVDLANDTSDG